MVDWLLVAVVVVVDPLPLLAMRFEFCFFFLLFLIPRHQLLSNWNGEKCVYSG